MLLIHLCLFNLLTTQKLNIKAQWEMMKCIIIITTLLVFTGSITAQTNEVQLPIKNFEKLWTEFCNRYANFELKRVDWFAVYDKYRPLVNENTTNKELFELSCNMLQELNDGHVTIEPDFVEDDQISCGPPYEFHFDKEFPTATEFRQFNAVVETTLSQAGFSSAIKPKVTKETNFQYRLSNSLGYLRLDEMTEKATFGRFSRAVDQAIEKFKNKKGIIIDLRFNGGGWDKNAYKLASRFITKDDVIGHFKKTKYNGRIGYTPLKYKGISPNGKHQFTKRIVILTSDYTASAAEVFVLLMKDLPNVTLIGDHTEGIFSDMYEFKLPNKWKISLSHQQFFSQKAVNYEGKGIWPEIRILNSQNDIQNQNDPVIERAIQFLN